MIYGYARVSSIGQARDGNSLEAQELALREKGCVKVFKEAYTGTTTDRPEFVKLLNVLQKGDTMMVTKLDRFSRTAAEGALLILMKNKLVSPVLKWVGDKRQLLETFKPLLPKHILMPL